MEENIVFEYIKSKKEITFVELEDFCKENKFIEEDKYFHLLTFKEYQNVIAWESKNKKLIDITTSLLNSKKISFKSCGMFFYLTDGVGLDMPIAKKLKNYKEPHWIPCLIYANVE